MANATNKPIELMLTVDAEAVKEMQDLQAKLGSDNLTTAVVNAVAIVEQLYNYQRQGYEIVLRKPSGEVEPLRLPA